MKPLVELKQQGLAEQKKADSITRHVVATFPTIMTGPFLKRTEVPTRADALTVFQLNHQEVPTFVVAHQGSENLQQQGNSILYTAADGTREQVIFDPPEPYTIQPLQIKHLYFGD